jgi:hypothetical protein
MAKNSPESLKARNEKRAHWKQTIDPSSFPHTLLKRCIACGEVAECKWMATFTQTGQPEYRSRCIECQKKHYKEIAANKRKKLSGYAKRRRQEFKAKYIEYLGGKCCRCGYSKCPRALTFHHRNREHKERELSAMLDWSWERVRAELDKCELVCFNCHMEWEEEFERVKNENNSE